MGLSLRGNPIFVWLSSPRTTYLVDLRPYSHDFHPIELAWSKLKNFLRKATARTSETLYATIAEGLKTLTAQGWFLHCGHKGFLKRKASYCPDPSNAIHCDTDGFRFFCRFDNGQIIVK